MSAFSLRRELISRAEQYARSQGRYASVRTEVGGEEIREALTELNP